MEALRSSTEVFGSSLKPDCSVNYNNGPISRAEGKGGVLLDK
jgi:hypothetical protein